MTLPLAVVTCGAVFYQLPVVQTAISKPNIWLHVGVPLACLVPFFVAFLGIWRGQRRIRLAVGAAQGRACINCVYDLRGLGQTGTCPECGHAFDIAADARRWERVNMQS